MAQETARVARRRLTLPDALHARPANLLVRLAQRFDARVRVTRGDTAADACKIMDVLALGAAKGDDIELSAEGTAAAEALEAIAELITRNFDGDLVPEVGAAVVEGIAIGHAVVWTRPSVVARPASLPAAERARVEGALARAKAGVADLVRVLPPSEAQLFEPELEILKDLGVRLAARISAGESAESAVSAETAQQTTDLLVDARARLLEALADENGGAFSALLAERSGEHVLVTEELTPTVVASLPAHVVGIVAFADGASPSRPDVAEARGAGYTSHAAILARGREIPLIFVAAHVAAGIADADLIVLDTTLPEARVWVAPAEALVQDARTRKAARADARAVEDAKITTALTHLGVEVRVNVGSLYERVPAGAEGVGLVRTELIFSGRVTAPSEAEQVAALVAIAARARGGPVVARLFDAGGDKPLPWLTPPSSADDARGIALLFHHLEVLDVQLRAFARAAERADVRVLLPLVTSARDVEQVRARTTGKIKIGAMIETPDAVEDAEAIAAVSDFVCIGTNDLSALALGHRREDAALSLDPRVLALIARVVERAHAHGRKVTVCGEMAGDLLGARVLVGLGVDALSVAVGRLAPTKIGLGAATKDECRRAARSAMKGET